MQLMIDGRSVPLQFRSESNEDGVLIWAFDLSKPIDDLSVISLRAADPDISLPDYTQKNVPVLIQEMPAVTHAKLCK